MELVRPGFRPPPVPPWKAARAAAAAWTVRNAAALNYGGGAVALVALGALAAELVAPAGDPARHGRQLTQASGMLLVAAGVLGWVSQAKDLVGADADDGGIALRVFPPATGAARWVVATPGYRCSADSLGAALESAGHSLARELDRTPRRRRLRPRLVVPADAPPPAAG